jgi:hypothetical protein
MLAFLAMVFPLIGLVALPPFRRLALASWRRGGWEVFCLCAFVYSLAINFITNYGFNQLRFFCVMTPFLYAATALVFADAGETWRRLLGLLVSLTALLMVTTAFYNTVISPENMMLYPSLVLYLPMLRPYYP